MLDITNRTIDDVNLLIQKYNSVLEVIKYKERIPYIAVIIDIAIKYINEKYTELTNDIKAWTIHILNELCEIINNENDVKEIINEFVNYYKLEYQKHIDSIVMFTNDYDRDWAFMYTFIKKEKSVILKLPIN